MVFQTKGRNLVIRMLAYLFVAMMSFVFGQKDSLLSAQAKLTLNNHVDMYGEPVDLSLWRADFLERCYFQGKENTSNANVQEIEALLISLEKVPELASYILEAASQIHTAFCMDDKVDYSYAYYDKIHNLIDLKTYLAFNEQLIFFVHELRHIDQISRGFCPSLDYAVKEMASLTLALEADAQAITTLYAWRMKSNGYPEIWTTLNKIENYVDIGNAFTKELEESGDELLATRAAFEQWYGAEWRTKNYYFNACLSYWVMQDRNNTPDNYTLLPTDYYKSLCRLPGGENYGCHLTDKIR